MHDFFRKFVINYVKHQGTKYQLVFCGAQQKVKILKISIPENLKPKGLIFIKSYFDNRHTLQADTFNYKDKGFLIVQHHN